MYMCGHRCWTYWQIVPELSSSSLVGPETFFFPQAQLQRFRAQWMFELAPGGGSSSLESRPWRATRGSSLRAVDTRGKQELAKEEKLSVRGVVLGKMVTSVPGCPSLTTFCRPLDDTLLLLSCRYTVLLELFGNIHPWDSPGLKDRCLWICLTEARKGKKLV